MSTAPDQSKPSDTTAPWGRLDTETDKSYAAFCCYLELGPKRSHQGVANALGYKGKRWIHDWSRQHGWVERARAYDAQLEAVAFEAAIEERRRLAREAVARQVEVQQGFFAHVAAAPQSLRNIADDARALDSARVRAWQLILDGSGYTPIAPADTRTDATEQLVAALHHLAAHLEPRESDYLFHLVDKAIEAAAQDPQEGGGQGEEEDDGGA